MFDQDGNVLYVGKAKNLRKRLASYFSRSIPDRKTYSLLEHLVHVTVTITHSKNEALLLENNLIKEFKPRYNIY